MDKKEGQREGGEKKEKRIEGRRNKGEKKTDKKKGKKGEGRTKEGRRERGEGRGEVGQAFLIHCVRSIQDSPEITSTIFSPPRVPECMILGNYR